MRFTLIFLCLLCATGCSSKLQDHTRECTQLEGGSNISFDEISLYETLYDIHFIKEKSSFQKNDLRFFFQAVGARPKAEIRIMASSLFKSIFDTLNKKLPEKERFPQIDIQFIGEDKKVLLAPAIGYVVANYSGVIYKRFAEGDVFKEHETYPEIDRYRYTQNREVPYRKLKKIVHNLQFSCAS